MFGVTFVGITLLSFMRSRRSLPWLLSLAVSFPASVVLAAGGNGLPAFFVLAVAAAFVAFHRWFSEEPTMAGPGKPTLVVFTVVAVVMTALGPWLFAGTDVLAAREGIDKSVSDPADLDYTVSNLAQGVYLLLGVAVVVYLAGTRRVSPALLGLGFAIGTGLSFLRLLTQWASVPWPLSFIDNSPSTSYVNRTATGEMRLRGVFAEPSELATFSLAAAAFFLSMGWLAQGGRRWMWWGLAALCCVNLWAAKSGTALVAGGVMVALAVLAGLVRFAKGRVRAFPAVVIALPLGAAWLVWSRVDVFQLVGDLVRDKLGTVSYIHRTAADGFSLDLMWETVGFGVGLGSNRPSSFVPMLLSCVGVLGTLLFVGAVFALARAAWRHPEWRPTVWALVGLLVAKGFAGPDLALPVLWLCIGLCAHAAWSPRQPAARAVPGRWAPVQTSRHTPDTFIR